MEYMKIEGHSNLVRDPNTNTIVNVDSREYNEYLTRKKSLKNKDIKIESLENQLEELRGDLNEIKILLKNLSNNIK